MRQLAFVVALLGLGAVGCGGDGGQVMEASVPPAEVQMKSMLEDAAKTGQSMGSGAMILMEGIDSIRERDAAKADALQQEYEELSIATEPAKVKSSAQAMLDKL